jgi:hypothetical protein
MACWRPQEGHIWGWASSVKVLGWIPAMKKNMVYSGDFDILGLRVHFEHHLVSMRINAV